MTDQTDLYEIADELRNGSDSIHKAKNLASEADKSSDVDLQELEDKLQRLRDEVNKQVRYVVRTAEDLQPEE